jgi:hypothetical protein
MTKCLISARPLRWGDRKRVGKKAMRGEGESLAREGAPFRVMGGCCIAASPIVSKPIDRNGALCIDTVPSRCPAPEQGVEPTLPELTRTTDGTHGPG